MSAPRARLFVALDPPDDVRAHIAGWARQALGSRPGLRLIEAVQLHVTLCFLGWREEAELEVLAEATEACGSPVRDLELGPPAWLPPRRPRVLAVDLADGRGELAALQRQVSEALARRAGYRPEKRPFRPHVTVARVPRGSPIRGRGPRVAAPAAVPAFPGAALTLYRSRLAREGARYEPVMRVRLGTMTPERGQ